MGLNELAEVTRLHRPTADVLRHFEHQSAEFSTRR